MNIVDSFLWVTALTYFIAVLSPKKFQKNWGFISQKVAWLMIGLLWVIRLTIPIHSIFWLVLGSFYILATYLSYTGVQNWGSKEHNLFMAVWDLILAVICISKF